MSHPLSDRGLMVVRQPSPSVATLFVQEDGIYASAPGVDLWGPSRDARGYAGPLPVVAHPPCERWGKFGSGSPHPSAKREIPGEDDGCFAAALKAVRKWGGVLEHPAHSKAWRAFDMETPLREGGWLSADREGGWTCWVDQGHYGHFAPKGTWLYAFGLNPPPPLRWGPSGRVIPEGPDYQKASRRGPLGALGSGDPRRSATPRDFRDVLLAIARASQATKGAFFEAPPLPSPELSI